MADQLLTARELADRVGVPLHRLDYLLANRPDECPEPTRIGLYRVWPESSVDSFRALLCEKKHRPDMAPELNLDERE